MRRSIPSILIAAIALASASLGKAEDTPNIIVLLADDLCYIKKAQINSIIDELERRGGGLQDLVELVVTSETFLTN